MNRQQLVSHIFNRQSYLCVGLDTDLSKIPVHLQGRPDAMLAFNKAIIDATRPYCVAYKINTAFYEAEGLAGWEVLQETAAYIGNEHLRIADAKRGDIGNTSDQYARAFFEKMQFDALTVAPYMGEDSLRSFLNYKDKWTIVLGLTSNPGAGDFELQKIVTVEETLDEGVHVQKHREMFLYEAVLEKVSRWGTTENLMFVTGATRPDTFKSIRAITPHHFYLVPGVGAQGGDLAAVSANAMIGDCGLLVNASRAVIYASAGEDFAEAAGQAAADYAAEMRSLLK